MENRIINKMAGIVVAAALIVVGLGFMLLGLTIFPLVGILPGIAFIASAASFLGLVAAKEERALYCVWPPTSAEACMVRC